MCIIWQKASVCFHLEQAGEIFVNCRIAGKQAAWWCVVCVHVCVHACVHMCAYISSAKLSETRHLP